MTVTITVVVSLVAAAVAYTVGYARGRASAQSTTPPHEHQWSMWEHTGTANIYDPYNPNGRPIRQEVTQERTCHICGLTEYDRRRK